MPISSPSPAEARRTKLDRLVETEGFRSLEALVVDVTLEQACPGICLTEGCDYTTAVESDQARGWCEICNNNTVASALVLAGLI